MSQNDTDYVDQGQKERPSVSTRAGFPALPYIHAQQRVHATNPACQRATDEDIAYRYCLLVLSMSLDLPFYTTYASNAQWTTNKITTQPANDHLELLCLKRRIPIIAPADPPNAVQNKSSFSGIRGRRFIAARLSQPNRSNTPMLTAKSKNGHPPPHTAPAIARTSQISSAKTMSLS